MLAQLHTIFTYTIRGAKNLPFRKQQPDLDIDLALDGGDFEYLNTLACMTGSPL